MVKEQKFNLTCSCIHKTSSFMFFSEIYYSAFEEFFIKYQTAFTLSMSNLRNEIHLRLKLKLIIRRILAGALCYFIGTFFCQVLHSPSLCKICCSDTLAWSRLTVFHYISFNTLQIMLVQVHKTISFIILYFIGIDWFNYNFPKQ